MTDASEDPTTPTMREVRGALWSVLGRIERGALKHDVGQVLINGYGSMYKMLMDKRDSVWTKRAEVLWSERQQKTRAESPSPH
jgi:hypothetical protein